MSQRDKIFISYAHEDAAWKDEFEGMLAPVKDRGIVQVWSDEGIEAGGKWDDEIKKALNSARVGLLLVTDSFLKSEFISRVEMRDLLNAAKKGGVSIHWVPISASLYEYTELGEIQACCDPEKPLDKFEGADRKAAIKQICEGVIQAYGALPKVSQGRRDDLRAQVDAQIGEKYEIIDELAAGKYSLLYKATSADPGRTVAIKTFVASQLDEWALSAFLRGVKGAVNLTSPAFLKVFDQFLGAPPHCLVLEYAEAEQLDKVLARPENEHGLPLARVKSILLDLARAVDEIHQRVKRARGEMCPSDVLIEESGMARLSAVDFSNILRDQAQYSGNFLEDHESLAYMTPERFDGQPHTMLSDQYSLGLIATELIGGPHIPSIRRPKDLEGKRELFENLRSGVGAWAERSPEFAGVVCRMLRIDPKARWPSMKVVRELLEGIQVDETLEERQRRIASASYLRLQARGVEGEREFFGKFYDRLFAALPDVVGHFESVDMTRQYQILNRAIYALLEFRPGSPARSAELQRIAASHEKYQLEARHYDGFIQSLLATLEESGEGDPETIEAWRARLSAGIDFMRKVHQPDAPPTGTPPPEPAKPEGRKVRVKEVRKGKKKRGSARPES